MTGTLVWITRKMTGNVVATDVPEDQVRLILSNLPSGVYAIENANGSEIAEAVVRNGRVVRYVCADYEECVDSADYAA